MDLNDSCGKSIQQENVSSPLEVRNPVSISSVTRMTSSSPVNRKNYWKEKSSPWSSSSCKNEVLNSLRRVLWTLARIRSCFAVPSCLGSPPAWTFAHPPNSGEGPTFAAIVNVGRFPGPARGLFLRCPAGVACGILPTPFPARGFGPLKRFRIGPTPISSTHTNVGFCCPTRCPTPAASDDRCLDVTAGPNPLQHSLQFVS